jgi:hypothetical protein
MVTRDLMDQQLDFVEIDFMPEVTVTVTCISEISKPTDDLVATQVDQNL